MPIPAILTTRSLSTVSYNSRKRFIHLERSMCSIAKRRVFRRFAVAHRRVTGLGHFKHLGRQTGPFVRSVTPGLIAGTPTGAPEILARLQFQFLRYLRVYNRLFHYVIPHLSINVHAHSGSIEHLNGYPSRSAVSWTVFIFVSAIAEG